MAADAASFNGGGGGGLWDYVGLNDDSLTSTPPPTSSLEEDGSSSSGIIDDDYILGLISPLSDGQEVVLSILQVFSATLSIIGSALIVQKVTRNRTRTTSYDRILLGLSTTDIIASFTQAMSPFWLPKITSQRVWAFGNETTCSALGFLTQFSFWAVWYNGMLSCYYLAIIKFQMKPKEFAKTIEWFIHVSGLLFFTITSSLGAASDWYSEQQLTMGCWIGEVPKGCTAAGTCTGLGQLIAYMFGGLPIAITLLALVINNILIYRYVRQSLLSPDDIAAARQRNNNPAVGITVGRRRRRRNRSGDSNINSNNAWVNRQPLDPREEQRILRQQHQTREVATQGFLYVSTFLLTFAPAFGLQVIDGIGFSEKDQGRLYPLLVLNSLLLPLQGFFNVFIYTKPNYKRFRLAHPDDPAWMILKRALLDQNIPRLSTAVSISNSNVASSQRRSGVSNDRLRQQLTQQRIDAKHSNYKEKSGSNFSSGLEILEEEASEDLQREESSKAFFKDNCNMPKPDDIDDDDIDDNDIDVNDDDDRDIEYLNDSFGSNSGNKSDDDFRISKAEPEDNTAGTCDGSTD